METEHPHSPIEIADSARLEGLITKIAEAGADQLHVLTDFDRTLTTAQVDGRPVPSQISILRDHGFLTPDYPARARALFDQYHPIEIDPAVPLPEKKAAMEAWWSAHFALLAECGLTRADIQQAVDLGKLRFRPGSADFFKLLSKARVPLIILSASGLGDEAIRLALQREGFLSSNVRVIGNEFTWDAGGKLTGVKKPIIHNFNKDETVLRSYPAIFNLIEHRRNVLLLGDSLSDVGMASGRAPDTIIKVGFLNEGREHLAAYRAAFDAVVLDDGDLGFVNSLLSRIC